MITEDQVIEAYRKALRLNLRRVMLESVRYDVAGDREETSDEQDERLEAVTAHSTLELQYLAERA